MNITQKDLDSWPRTCERLRNLMEETLLLLTQGKMEAAQELVEFAYVSAVVLGTDMRQAGAARPKRLTTPPDVPLSLLCSKANWQYARTLRAAYQAGMAVDRERGWEEEGPAQILRMILTDVETQVFGAQASVPIP